MPAAPDLPQEAPAAPVKETPPEKAAPEVPPEPVPAEEKPAQEPDVPAAEPEKHEEPAPEQKPIQPEPAPEKTAAPQEDSQKAERRRKISAMMDAVPAYQPYGRRMHVLDIEDLGAALETEAQAYAPRTSKKRFLGNIPDEQAELGEEQPQKPEQEVHTASRKGEKFALFGGKICTARTDRRSRPADDIFGELFALGREAHVGVVRGGVVFGIALLAHGGESARNCRLVFEREFYKLARSKSLGMAVEIIKAHDVNGFQTELFYFVYLYSLYKFVQP